NAAPLPPLLPQPFDKLGRGDAVVEVLGALARYVEPLADADPQPAIFDRVGSLLGRYLVQAALPSHLSVGHRGTARVVVEEAADAEQHNLGGGALLAEPHAVEEDLLGRHAGQWVVAQNRLDGRRAAVAVEVLVRREAAVRSLELGRVDDL